MTYGRVNRFNSYNSPLDWTIYSPPQIQNLTPVVLRHPLLARITLAWLLATLKIPGICHDIPLWWRWSLFSPFGEGTTDIHILAFVCLS